MSNILNSSPYGGKENDIILYHDDTGERRRINIVSREEDCDGGIFFCRKCNLRRLMKQHCNFKVHLEPYILVNRPLNSRVLYVIEKFSPPASRKKFKKVWTKNYLCPRGKMTCFTFLS